MLPRARDRIVGWIEKGWYESSDPDAETTTMDVPLDEGEDGVEVELEQEGLEDDEAEEVGESMETEAGAKEL